MNILIETNALVSDLVYSSQLFSCVRRTPYEQYFLW